MYFGVSVFIFFGDIYIYIERERDRERERERGFPGGSDGRASTCNVGDLGWEDPLEEGMATHSSILAWRISRDRGAWWATAHEVTKNWT